MSVAVEWSTERLTSETSKQRTKWSKGRKEERKKEGKDEGKGKKEPLLGDVSVRLSPSVAFQRAQSGPCLHVLSLKV